MFGPQACIEDLIEGTQLIVPAKLIHLPQDGLDEAGSGLVSDRIEINLLCNSISSFGAKQEPCIIAATSSPKVSSTTSLHPLAEPQHLLLVGAASSSSLDGVLWRISLQCWGDRN